MEAVPAKIVLRRCAALVALLSILAHAAPSARATVLVGKSFRDLCAEADLVFVGTVASVESRWADAQRQAIETMVTFSVATVMLGAPRDQAQLRFAGGRVEGRRSEVVGLPTFAEGDRVIVFARSGRAVSPIVGFNQGLFRIRDAGAGPTVVAADGRSPVRLGAVPADAGGAAQAVSAPLGLDRFLDMIRSELASPPGSPP